MNAIEKIHEFEKYGSVLGLERISVLLERLGNPEKHMRYVHVAGTNGKGSVSKYIYCMLADAGYNVGLYTSPFLEIFNERIELNGEYISDYDLQHYTDIVLRKVDEMVGEGLASPTEFEVITAVAFLYFYEKGTDIVVLEVGLGGIGDSTNVIEKPMISVITSISYDHTDRLGTTLSEIAFNKAGIIKDNCPVVTSASSGEALAVIEKAAQEHGSMYFETRNLPYIVRSEELNGTTIDVDIQGVEFRELYIGMTGRHQIQNAILALTAICIMEERGDVSVHRAAIYSGIKRAKQIGRFEILNDIIDNPSYKDKVKCQIIFDGAHNPDGARTLSETCRNLLKGKKVLLLTGMLRDKDVDSVMDEFRKLADDFIVTEPPNPRKMDAPELAKIIRERGGRTTAWKDYHDALDMAISASKDYDVVLAAGSLYLIGALRKELHS